MDSRVEKSSKKVSGRNKISLEKIFYREKAKIKRKEKSQKDVQKEETDNLVRKAKTGDIEARNILIETHLNLIKKAVSHFRRFRGFSFEDLVQEAVFCVIGALKDFDSSKGASFSTFLVTRIYWDIRAYILENTPIIKLNRHQTEAEITMKNITAKYEAQFGRLPGIEEIAELSGKDLKVLEKRKLWETRIVFFDDVPTEGFLGDKLDFMDACPDLYSLSPMQQFIVNDELQECRKEILDLIEKIQSLPKEKTQKIFTSFYGLDGSFEKKTLEEVGLEWKVTREAIRQTIKKTWWILSRKGFNQNRLEELAGRCKRFTELAHVEIDQFLERIRNSVTTVCVQDNRG